LDPVRHEVVVRPVDANDDAPLVHWSLAQLELDEELGRPYVATITLTTEDALIQVDDLVAADVELCSTRGDEPSRVIHGVVLRAQDLGIHDGRLAVRLVVGPALCLLATTRRSRIFCGHDAVAIVGQVVADVLAGRGRALVTSRLSRSYPVLEHCVQYRETDLDFVLRVLATAGVTIAWDHTGRHEALVLLDDNAGFVPIGESFVAGCDGASPTSIDVVTGTAADRCGITSLRWRRAIAPATHHVTAWDWKSGTPTQLASSSEDIPAAPWSIGRWVEHGAQRLVESDLGDGALLDETARWVEDDRARSLLDAVVVTVSANVVGLGAGNTFESYGHPNPALDRPYVVTRATHRAQVARHVDGTLASDYACELVVQPLGQRYRPAPPPRPRVAGPHLATVVGPQTDEIHTDALGRIKVWMRWDDDRDPTNAARSTCWVRVAQLWAGAGYGACWIPRVGMEVVVVFVDGNPDEPLVTGCVYNGGNPPPEALPDDRTRSVFRTASSPGGIAAGFNELRFEDAAGAEQVYLRAQRDLDERVLANHTTHIGRNETLVVGNDRSKRVDGDEHRGVAGDRTTTIGGSDNAIVRGGRRREVECAPAAPGGPATYDAVLVHGERAVWAEQRCTTLCGPVDSPQSRVELAPSEIVITAESSFRIEVGDTTLVMTPAGVTIRAARIELVARTSALALDDDAVLFSEHKTRVGQGDAALELAESKALLASQDTRLEITTGPDAAHLRLSSIAELGGETVVARSTKGESTLRIEAERLSTSSQTAEHDAVTSYAVRAARIDLN
jgi:type VI secretion system secreted protein VgrG